MKIHSIWKKHGSPNFERRDVIRAKYLDAVEFSRAVCSHYHKPMNDMLMMDDVDEESGAAKDRQSEEIAQLAKKKT